MVKNHLLSKSKREIVPENESDISDICSDGFSISQREEKKIIFKDDLHFFFFIRHYLRF